MPDWVVGAITSSFYRDKQGRYCEVEGLPKGWKWGLQSWGEQGPSAPPNPGNVRAPRHPVLHTEVWWRAAAGKAERMGWRNTLGRGSLAHSGHLEGIHPGRNLGLLLSSHSVVSDFL